MTEPLSGATVAVAPGGAPASEPTPPATRPAAKAPKSAVRPGPASPAAEAPAPPGPVARSAAKATPAAEASQDARATSGRAVFDVGTARPALVVPTPPRGHPRSTGAVLRQSLVPPPEPAARPAPGKPEPAVSPGSLEAKSRRFAGEFLTMPASRPARPQAAPRPVADAVRPPVPSRPAAPMTAAAPTPATRPQAQTPRPAMARSVAAPAPAAKAPVSAPVAPKAAEAAPAPIRARAAPRRSRRWMAAAASVVGVAAVGATLFVLRKPEPAPTSAPVYAAAAVAEVSPSQPAALPSAPSIDPATWSVEGPAPARRATPTRRVKVAQAPAGEPLVAPAEPLSITPPMLEPAAPAPSEAVQPTPAAPPPSDPDAPIATGSPELS